jgi:hypothetical protein
MAGMTIHIALESTIHIAGIRSMSEGTNSKQLRTKGESFRSATIDLVAGPADSYRLNLLLWDGRATTPCPKFTTAARKPSLNSRLVLRSEPNNTQAHNSLAITLAQMPGRLPDAIAEYHAALQINPDYAQARANLESACATDSVDSYI